MIDVRRRLGKLTYCLTLINFNTLQNNFSQVSTHIKTNNKIKSRLYVYKIFDENSLGFRVEINESPLKRKRRIIMSHHIYIGRLCAIFIHYIDVITLCVYVITIGRHRRLSSPKVFVSFTDFSQNLETK